MIYDNITYPLDKIYSKATGVSYPVCATGHDNAQPTPDPTPTPDPEPENIEGLEFTSNLVMSVEYTPDPLEEEFNNFTCRLECNQAVPEGYVFELIGKDEDNHTCFIIGLKRSEDNHSILVYDEDFAQNDPTFTEMIDTTGTAKVNTITYNQTEVENIFALSDPIEWECTGVLVEPQL